MQIYANKNWKLDQVKEIWFDLEKDMQVLVENNMEDIFGIEFIATEFQLNNLRIDSLAFDKETKSFVIIEYKRWTSYSVIDQGMTYLALMLNNKADFVQQLAKKRNKFIDVNSIEWSQSRVIIVADRFNRYQKESINFKDLAIELWELKKFSNNTIVFNPIKATKTSESIKTITKFKNNEYEKVNTEIKTFTIEDHFKEWWKKSRELFEIVREKILSLDSRFEEKATMPYIGYKIGNAVVVSLKIRKSKIVLELLRVRPEDLNDPENKTQEVKWAMQMWNKYVSNFDINSEEDIDYGINLTKQILKKFFL